MSPHAATTGGEGRRKLVHIGSAGFALLLAWITWPQAAALAAAAFLFNLLILPRLGGRALWREEDERRGYPLGILLYPLMVLFFLLLFRQRLHLAALLWGLLAFGDGFASLGGRRWGGFGRLPWNPDKSVVGSLVYILAGGLGAAYLVLWVEPELPFLRVAWLVVPVVLLGALIESWDTGLDDNLTTSLVTAPALWVLAATEPGRILDTLEAGVPVGQDLATMLTAAWVLAPAANFVLALAARTARSVDWSGMLGGWILGTGLWLLAGWQAWCLLVLFFVLGSLLTRLGRRRKEALGAAQEKGGRRSARHAWANGGTALWLALGLAGARDPHLFALALAAAFATAVFDTASSEGGMAWGRRAFHPLRLRPVPPGTEGAVSLEGTASGLVGAGVLAAAAWGLGLVSGPGAVVVLLAGLVGGLGESVIGAAFGKAIDNEFLNLLNTILGAAAACLLALWLL